MDSAPACRDVPDPDIFFPNRPQGMKFTGAGWRDQTAEARALCAGCPVRARCLEQNLDIPDGIFGGLDSHERGQLLQGEGRVKSTGAPQFRNMSPFENDHLVLGARARWAAEQEGNLKKLRDARAREAWRTRQRESDLARTG